MITTLCKDLGYKRAPKSRGLQSCDEFLTKNCTQTAFSCWKYVFV